MHSHINSYYVNAPGYSKDVACSWSEAENGPYGNWAPYVLGMSRTPITGEIHVSLSWNPVYLEFSSPWRDQLPEFGVQIRCNGPNCKDGDCKIDPLIDGINGIGRKRIEGQTTEKGPANQYCDVAIAAGDEMEIQLFERPH